MRLRRAQVQQMLGHGEAGVTLAREASSLLAPPEAAGPLPTTAKLAPPAPLVATALPHLGEALLARRLTAANHLPTGHAPSGRSRGSRSRPWRRSTGAQDVVRRIVPVDMLDGQDAAARAGVEALPEKAEALELYRMTERARETWNPR